MEEVLARASIKVLDNESIERIHNDLFTRNETYYKLLNEFIIPIRLSILTLLSQKKASIYSDELIHFMLELMKSTKLKDIP